MAVEHVDVLIVGAGLSGIGAAAHLQDRCPDTTWTIVEARTDIGGTWDLFRYPGVRSDSDMFTLGYSFRPWTDPAAIAGGAAILDYVRDTARERGIDRAIRFGHRIGGSVVQRGGALDGHGRDGHRHRRADLRLSVLLRRLLPLRPRACPRTCGHRPFAGEIVHPQHWPADLDWAGKKIVVIGSGATAVTLVPALAQTAAHVTMLQRPPATCCRCRLGTRWRRRCSRGFLEGSPPRSCG